MKKTYESMVFEVIGISSEDVLTCSSGFYGDEHLLPVPGEDLP